MSLCRGQSIMAVRLSGRGCPSHIGGWEVERKAGAQVSFNALLNCDLLPSAVSSLKSSHLSHVGQPFKCSILQGTHCIRAITPRHPVANPLCPPVPPLIITRPSPCVASFLGRMLSMQHSGHTLLHTISCQAHL